MKIAVAIEHFNPMEGGAERSTAETVRELLARDHEVTVIAGSAKASTLPDGVKLLAMREKKSSGALQLKRFSLWANHQIDNGGFDTTLSITMAVGAHVLQPRGGTVRETLERNIALRKGAMKQQWKRWMISLNPKQRALLKLERQHLAPDSRVKKIVALSEYVVEQLRIHYNVADDRIVVIPNAAAMPEASHQLKSQWRQAVHQQYAIPEDATGIYLYAAQNPRLKGFGTILEAVRLMVKAGQRPVVLLAGRFGYKDQDVAARMGIRDNLRFIGETSQMATLYAAADVTVLPSYYDPSSKVVIESLMMGRPAISSGFNGASDFLSPVIDADGNSADRGIVVNDPGDAPGWAQAMTAIVEKSQYDAFAAATDGLREQLSMKRHVDQLEKVLSDACG
ncbi:Lipopolysaccharide core biosynthesis protein RfaG [Poriferisphaera corsica]|uniref:Lipopolysaccharide core biosynthesis protein RfaG n=1 Tax=Poriferisphaera corsica TaxID=2528020 RepID=A0A517YTF8_9BACT|nr:glycosyltransferase family 4 protein [Poriferisphaera corsica]QDU33520.1 Lipopolysaccharide core biosynthesis protein RfaG [Poriferisphaera corsica]